MTLTFSFMPGSISVRDSVARPPSETPQPCRACPERGARVRAHLDLKPGEGPQKDWQGAGALVYEYFSIEESDHLSSRGPHGRSLLPSWAPPGVGMGEMRTDGEPAPTGIWLVSGHDPRAGRGSSTAAQDFWLCWSPAVPDNPRQAPSPGPRFFSCNSSLLRSHRTQ